MPIFPDAIAPGSETGTIDVAGKSGIAMTNDREQQELEDRRNFLKSAGRFAAVTPPATTLLLSTSLTSDAIASSGAHRVPKGNNGYGNRGGGSPNNRSTRTASESLDLLAGLPDLPRSGEDTACSFKRQRPTAVS